MKSNNQVDKFIKSSILLCRLYADTDYSSFDKKYEPDVDSVPEPPISL